jgi:serine/threonine protein phosphatase PrpC
MTDATTGTTTGSGPQRALRGGTADALDAPRRCRACAHGARIGDGGRCPNCGSPLSDGTDRVESDLGPLSGVSDRGLVHGRNEDAMALGRRVSGLLAAVVCDGVSSSPHPQLASQAAAEATLDLLLACDAGTVGPRRVREAVAAGARAVEALAVGGGGDAAGGPACTLVAAVVEPGSEPPAPHVIVAWVGDSRAYWLSATGSRVLTTDHSWAEEVVSAGRMDVATAALDRRAHAITRWLGAGGEPFPDLAAFTPDGPGVLLLCSDGLWNYLPGADELAAVALPAAFTDPLGAAAELTAIALEAGGRDNITVVVLPVGDPVPPR